MVDDESGFVVVLIGQFFHSFCGGEEGRGGRELMGFEELDEVESLTAARAGAMSGKEPSDALRVRSLSSLHLSATPSTKFSLLNLLSILAERY